MTYKTPVKYTDVQLLAFEIEDLLTEIRCAIRDGLPESYVKECTEKKDEKMTELLRITIFGK
jgi:hypothetical protein